MLDWTVVVYYHHSMGYEGFFMNKRFPLSVSCFIYCLIGITVSESGKVSW